MGPQAPTSVCGLRPRFRGLSPPVRQVTYVLRTRSPLPPKGAFDLHVLGMPPTFILSQDQTLREKPNRFAPVIVLTSSPLFGVGFYHSSVDKVPPAVSRRQVGHFTRSHRYVKSGAVASRTCKRRCRTKKPLSRESRFSLVVRICLPLGDEIGAPR